MARIGGKQTVDGTLCQRPPGCRIRHKGRSPVDRASEIAAATVDGELTLDDYATETASNVFVPLNQTGMVVEPTGVEDISVEQIMALLNRPKLSGITISPKQTEAVDLNEATRGIAVTLPGSDLRFDLNTETPSRHQSTMTSEHSPPDNTPPNIAALGIDIDAFLQHMQPVTDTGTAWIGLWKNGGIIELNVTVVDENHEQEAIQMGDRWDQKAVYHLGRSKTIPTGGTGWQSIYTDKQATDEPDTGLRSRLR